MRHVQAHPGTSRAQISKALDVARQDLNEHIVVLEKRRRIHVVKGRRGGVYPPSYDVRDLVAILCRDVSAMIVDHLHKRPGARVAEMAGALAVPKSVVRRHLRQLDERGFIRATGEICKRYQLAEEAPSRARSAGLSVQRV